MTIKHLGGIFGRNPTFSDVTIDGGIYIGGDTSSNFLDDYEEGTWTPVLAAATTDPTPTSVTVNNATYTKIGRMVHVQAWITANLTDIGSGGARITGLPFVVGSGMSVVKFSHSNLILSNGGIFYNGSSSFWAIEDYTTNGIGFAGTGSRNLMFAGTYETA